jgi:hypothetical protein
MMNIGRCYTTQKQADTTIIIIHTIHTITSITSITIIIAVMVMAPETADSPPKTLMALLPPAV